MTQAEIAAPPALRISGISKAYGPTRVLQDITFDIKRGRVHALVGENGAGKSTLVKIITGIVTEDAGAIEVNGRPAAFRTPTEARAGGVSAVYQDPKLLPHLDVAENIFVGNFPRTVLGTVDRKAMYAGARRALQKLGVGLDPRSLVAALSVAELQFVEIARALSSDIQVLILDEPTSPLTPAEAEKLFGVVRALRVEGKSVLLITHRLEEVEAVADDVTVLRDGRHIATRAVRDLDRAGIVNLMVGRNIETMFVRHERVNLGPELLKVERLGLAGAFADVSFSLRAGEIVGMAGLVGAGRSEIAQAIFGMTAPTAGRIVLNGREVAPEAPEQMLRLGVAYLPEDRDGQGLIMAETIADNVTLPIANRLARFGLLDRRREHEIAAEAIAAYRVRARSADQVVSTLSGGNRQKVAFARWLATSPAVLILDEPTHGVDVGSKAQIHQIIRDLAESGLAVLMISSDLPEILAMSDRILVVAEGRIVAEIEGRSATQEAVMRAATRSAETAHVVQ